MPAHWGDNRTMKITRLTVFVPGGNEQFSDSDTVKITVDEERGIARIDAQSFRQVFVGLPLEIVYETTPVSGRVSV
jgi:hypothetical protein